MAFGCSVPDVLLLDSIGGGLWTECSEADVLLSTHCWPRGQKFGYGKICPQVLLEVLFFFFSFTPPTAGLGKTDLLLVLQMEIMPRERERQVPVPCYRRNKTL